MTKQFERVRDVKFRLASRRIGTYDFVEMARNAGGRWREKLQPIFFAAAVANRRFEQDLKKLEEDRQRESEALDAKGAGTDERRAASERLQSRKDDRIRDAITGHVKWSPRCRSCR